MTQIEKWLVTNKLTLNVKKSCFTIFRSPKLKVQNLPDAITFNKSVITRSKSVKYLGVTLDEFLNFKEHTINICNSLKKYFRIFYNIRRYMNKSQSTSLYYSYIYSRIQYAISIYCANSQSNINMLQTMQNKLLKVLLSKGMRYSTKQLHNDLDILKICDLEYLESLTFVKNFMLNKLPDAFSNYYSKPNHNINTRGLNSLLVVPQSTNNFGASSMKIRGASRWNALSSELKSVDKIHTFRKLWKKTKCPYRN